MSVAFLYPLTRSFALISLPLFFSSAAFFLSLSHCPIPQLSLPPMSAPEFLLKPIQTAYATFPLLLSFAPSVSCSSFPSYLLNSPRPPHRHLYCRHLYLPTSPNKVFCFFFLLHINHSLSLFLSHTFPPLPLSLLMAKNTSSHSTLVGIF